MLRGAPPTTAFAGAGGGWQPGVPDDLGDVVATAALEAGVRVHERRAEPGHPLEQLADLVGLVDFAATYLAVGLGLDPGVSAHVRALRDHGR